MLFLAALPVAIGDGYPNGWRGDTSGVWPQAKVPVEWDGQSGKNIRWKVRLPTHGSNGQPVFGPGKVLVLSEPEIVQCFSTKDGSLLWQKGFSCIDVEAPEAERKELHEKLFRACCETFGYDPADTTKTKKAVKHTPLLREVQAKCKYPAFITTAWKETGHSAATPAATKDRIVIRHASNILGCFDWDGNLEWTAHPAKNHPIKGNHDLSHMGNVHIIEQAGDAPDLVICHFVPDHEYLGMTQAEYREKKYPLGDAKTKSFGIEALVAFDLATGSEVWRSKGHRHAGLRCNNTAQVRVGGEMLIVTPGGDVVRARDGELVIKEIGWTGYGNTAGVLEEADGTALVVFNEGCRRWAPRNGHHLRAHRLRKDGDGFKAEKLWEWGWEGQDGVQVSSPVILGGKVFLGGNQGYVFDVLKGTPLIVPSDASKDGVKAFGRNRGVLKMNCEKYLNPIAVGEYLYMGQNNGSVMVYSAKLEPATPKKEGDPKWRPKLLHHNHVDPKLEKRPRKPPMPQWTISTPQVWENCLYIRQNGWLWCIGAKDSGNR